MIIFFNLVSIDIILIFFLFKKNYNKNLHTVLKTDTGK